MSAVIFTIPGPPCPKPRMTQRDKWARRPAVLRYRAWADLARASAPKDLPARPTDVALTYFLPMPASWGARKRREHAGQPHAGKPDLDNLIKSLDALWADDSSISSLSASKRWEDAHGPRALVAVYLEVRT